MSATLDTELSQLVKNFETPPVAKDVIRGARMLLITGATASGKNTIIRQLLNSDSYHFLVSHTTRKPRVDSGVKEVDGDPYWFTEVDKMKQLIKDQKMIEVAILHRTYVSGVSSQEIQMAIDRNLIATSDVDVKGVELFKGISDQIKAIFVLPPDFDEWMDRLHKRYGDHEVHAEDINNRLKTAKEEIQRALNDGYFEFVVNEDFHEATKLIDRIAHGEVDAQEHERGVRVAKELLRGL